MENDTRKQVIELLQDKLQRLSIKENEIGNNFDLVKTGLLNSLEFVDMVASLEKLNNIEIDFEKALVSGEFTTIGGLIKAFTKNN
jgi:acyl carrier protein